jgi:hypothetical protein
VLILVEVWGTQRQSDKLPRWWESYGISVLLVLPAVLFGILVPLCFTDPKAWTLFRFHVSLSLYASLLSNSERSLQIETSKYLFL